MSGIKTLIIETLESCILLLVICEDTVRSWPSPEPSYVAAASRTIRNKHWLFVSHLIYAICQSHSDGLTHIYFFS